MIETLLFTLIAGLLLFQIFILRMLMKRQINQALKNLVEDWDNQPKKTNVIPVPNSPLVLHEYIKKG